MLTRASLYLNGLSLLFISFISETIIHEKSEKSSQMTSCPGHQLPCQSADACYFALAGFSLLLYLPMLWGAGVTYHAWLRKNIEEEIKTTCPRSRTK